MSDLEWKECGESQQLKAQGTGVVYWLIEHKDDVSLWVSPDSLNDSYTAFRGTEEGCIRNAELMEKDKNPNPVPWKIKSHEASRILKIPFEIIEYAKLAELVPIALARELLDLVEKSHSYAESE